MTVLKPEEKVRARNDALMRLPNRFQPASNAETRRNNIMESAVIALCYQVLHKPPEAIHTQQQKDTIEKFTAENEQAIIKDKAFEAEYTEASFKVAMEMLAPFNSDKRLKWTEHVTDTETGEKSPNMQQLFKAQYPAIAEALAITDVDAFRANIIDKYSDHSIVWKLDRWSLDGGYEKYQNKRHFEPTILLKVVKR
jgi:hypothetical protein